MNMTCDSCVYMQREHESLNVSIDKNKPQGPYANCNDSAVSQKQSKQQDHGQEISYVTY